MARRAVLTVRQREALLALPTSEADLLRHCVLSNADLVHVRRRRRDRNRLGFALQLCALRHPGRLIRSGELIPEALLAFVAAQLGLDSQAVADYAARSQTHYDHSAALQRIYGYRPFEGMVREQFADWLVGAAIEARTKEGLVASALGEMRRRRVIVPASSTLERACADALVAAERRIARRIADRLSPDARSRLARLLSEHVEDGPSRTMTRFVWLRRNEPGGNSADANRLLDRLDWLSRLAIPASVIDGVPAHRVAHLRRQGERYYADGLREVPEARRLAILTVCAVEWRATLADAIVETHDRITGRLYRQAQRTCAALVEGRKGAIAGVLRSVAALSNAMVQARTVGGDVAAAITWSIGWDEVAQLAATATSLTAAIDADPIDHLGSGHHRFRRYAPRMLDVLDLQGGRSAEPLLGAIAVQRDLNHRGHTNLSPDASVAFASTKWRKRLVPSETKAVDRRLWETAVLFALRDALRSGDVWLAHSHRYREPGRDLVPVKVIASPGAVPRLAVPLDAVEWIASRRSALERAVEDVSHAATTGTLGGAIEDGRLRADRLEADPPAGADDLTLNLYGTIPNARITDLLLDVDRWTGFTDAFTDLRTGSPCRDKIGLLSVILADGINLGLKKMAGAIGVRTHWQLLRIARWHVEDEAYKRALAAIVEAQGTLPMARVWGEGRTSSSDGQFFPAGGPGEAMNVVNARYGNEPGIRAYSHLSDQFAPFAVDTIPATASEAPFILDGLLGCDAGRRVREHYADTGGFTDHVFAACAMLGYSFAPRIRDLPDKRLYAFEPNAAPAIVRPLIAARIRTDLIERNWPDLLRLTASMALGTVQPSTILRKLAAYPRQNELASALREVGRVERSLFLLRWIADADLQRRAQLGINKGEAHHALKRAIAFGRRGEIRDRSSEGQHHRMAGLNLVAAAIIHWNARQLGTVVAERAAAGNAPDPALLPHVSPLGWEHIHLTGEYRWPNINP